ncbi:NADH:flavin oxidoreductase/NADH oxidase family protein [Streptomyces sp. NPDC002402]
MSPSPHAGQAALSSALTLGCGLTLPNRLAKAATSEHLADRFGAPTAQLIQAYRAMAASGVGLVISGNVMVDGSSLEAPRNVVIEDDRHIDALRRWSAVAADTPTRFILQLSHPGRQTMRGNTLPGRRQNVVAPSAVPLSTGADRLFRPPRALREEEITDIIGRFARAAEVAATAGFHGVQLHAAHGYLLNQFLSPLSNRRTDRWGGSLENRMRLLIEVFRAVKEVTPDNFMVAVKLNSADFQRGGFEPDDSLTVAKALEAEGVDLIEISGGTYENTAMFAGTSPRDSTRQREAYFLEFAERFSKEVSVPMMLTGGFRTRQVMIDALNSGAVDVVGLARPITHDPGFPRDLLAGSAERSSARPRNTGRKAVDAFLDSAWHQQQLARLGRGKDVRPKRGTAAALLIATLVTMRDILAPRLGMTFSGPRKRRSRPHG